MLPIFNLSGGTAQSGRSHCSIYAEPLLNFAGRADFAERRTHKERNHRIFLYGGFMESIVPELKTMTEDEGKDFLYHIAKSTEAQEYLKKRAEGVEAG